MLWVYIRIRSRTILTNITTRWRHNINKSRVITWIAVLWTTRRMICEHSCLDTCIKALNHLHAHPFTIKKLRTYTLTAIRHVLSCIKKKLKKSCLNVICSSYYTECFLKDSSLLIMCCISIILCIILYHSKETWRSFTAHPHMTILSVPVASLGYLSVWVHIYVCASVWLKPALHWRQYCIISSLLLSCITYVNSVIIYSL